MNQKQINQAVEQAIKTGNWMIRVERKDGYSPTCNFKWQPVGQWTEAPDWNPKPECGGGLHGQASEAGGCLPSGGEIVVFCETKGERVIINENKIKVREARRLLVGQLPKGLSFNSSLDLRDCDLTNIILPVLIKGNLNIDRSILKNTKMPRYVGGSLFMDGCNVKKIPQKVGRSIFMEEANIDGVKFQSELYGSLSIAGCNFKRVILPRVIHGRLDLNTCNLKGITLPEIVEGSVVLHGCKNVDIPESCTYRDRIIY